MIKLKISIVAICFCSFGCSIWKKSQKAPAKIIENFTEEDLNIIAAINYIKTVNKTCKDSCRIRVNKSLEYFDNCLELWDPAYSKRNYFDIEKKISLSQRNLIIDSFGIIFFVSENREPDYSFAPILIDVKKKYLLGQVKHKNGENFSFGLSLVGNKFYMSHIEGYPKDNCY